MKKQVLAIIAASFIAGTAFTAQAASTTLTVSGGTIQFMGSVVNAPCSVSADSEHGIVILDQVTLDSMGAKGETSGQAKAFNISLENCDVTTYTNATVTFHGQSSPDQAGVLANTAGSGAAKGVALQLFGPDGNKLDVEKESSKQILSTGTNKIPMSVDYVTTADAATAGAVESVATFQVTYS
ncbi:fimbrial protein [Enterobacter asburiae]|uniref:fimbrial protein n=1 Tax=Enterobacter cloacae complex TaxID=354276 RepID=UPI000738C93A|nr:fimbrial protein [Enterobacter asburiae]MBT2099068.1 fimbrial protein [Enterobacter asburiae]HCR2014532.1 fimbrial protein [Enterobacter asburiae]HCR2019402.1 fimbrial protein [Enterobacter asburiae]HCR2022688.1 fimbrial protein [Enterobacter asburiae]HCR2032720.1 fimbrial protein [Enterobacter asburiae]